MRVHEMKIIDAQSRREWEELIGCKIHGDVARATHEFYIEHLREIHAIQFGAAFRKVKP